MFYNLDLNIQYPYTTGIKVTKGMQMPFPA